MRGGFVTGTDTGVGKTVVAATITATLRSRGIDARGLKPVVSGLDEPAPPEWPHDHELLAQVSGTSGAESSLYRFGAPVSPHLAAQLSARPLDPAELCEAIRAAAAPAEVIVVEGVGGLLVPLVEGYDVRSLAADLGLPVVIVARPGLGTINHTLLTLEAARAASLPVAGVVLTPWPEEPTMLEQSNRRTIEQALEALGSS